MSKPNSAYPGPMAFLDDQTVRSLAGSAELDAIRFTVRNQPQTAATSWAMHTAYTAELARRGRR